VTNQRQKKTGPEELKKQLAGFVCFVAEFRELFVYFSVFLSMTAMEQESTDVLCYDKQ
jgi:hypothetical protein